MTTGRGGATTPRPRPLACALARLTVFWRQDHALSVFCLSLVVMIFALNPLVESGFPARFLLDGFMALVLVSGVVAIAHDRLSAVLAGAVATASILSRGLAAVFPCVQLTVFSLACTLLAVLLLAGVVLAHVFKPGEVSLHRIQGAVAAYLLLGFAWAHAYFLLYLTHSSAFNAPPLLQGAEKMPQFVYYSFVTLTTVGYGDMTPVHPYARSLAVMEALVGQLYPAILIARLVSLELQGRQQK